MNRWRIGLAAAGLLLVAGCGNEDSSKATEPATELTPAAIAEIVGDHVAQKPTKVVGWDVFRREVSKESVGASMDYPDFSLRVAVAPTSDSGLVCGSDDDFFDTCEEATLGGHDVLLGWQEMEPEEDPGVVYVIDRREDVDVAAQISGPMIEGDPRDLDLGVDLGDVAAAVTDPRLTLPAAD